MHLWILFYCIHFSYATFMYLGCHDTYIQFPSKGTLQIYMRITSACISKREIRTDDTADLAYRHGSFKNNGEDRGIGWRVCSDLRVRKNFEIVLWEEHHGGPACFVSLFVSTRVCTRDIPKGTKERVETAGATTSCHPEKPSRQCRLLRAGFAGAYNFIAARNPTRTISSSTKSRVVYRETAHLDRSACMPRAIPRSS